MYSKITYTNTYTYSNCALVIYHVIIVLLKYIVVGPNPTWDTLWHNKHSSQSLVPRAYWPPIAPSISPWLYKYTRIDQYTIWFGLQIDFCLRANVCKFWLGEEGTELTPYVCTKYSLHYQQILSKYVTWQLLTHTHSAQGETIIEILPVCIKIMTSHHLKMPHVYCIASMLITLWWSNNEFSLYIPFYHN